MISRCPSQSQIVVVLHTNNQTEITTKAWQRGFLGILSPIDSSIVCCLLLMVFLYIYLKNILLLKLILKVVVVDDCYIVRYNMVFGWTDRGFLSFLFYNTAEEQIHKRINHCCYYIMLNIINKLRFDR